MTPEVAREAAARLFQGNGDFRPARKTLQQGCATTLRAALDPALLAQEGVFLDDCRLCKTPADSPFLSAHALDADGAERLWRLSEELVGERFSF